MDEIEVGTVDGNILRMGTPPAKARLKLVVAKMVVATGAGCADSTDPHRRHGDAIAGLPLTDIRSDLADNSRELVAGNMGQPDIGIVTRPGMPVAPAQSACPDLHDHAVPGRFGIGNVPDRDRSAESLVYRCAHFSSETLKIAFYFEVRDNVGDEIPLPFSLVYENFEPVGSQKVEQEAPNPLP